MQIHLISFVLFFKDFVKDYIFIVHSPHYYHIAAKLELRSCLWTLGIVVWVREVFSKAIECGLYSAVTPTTFPGISECSYVFCEKHTMFSASSRCCYDCFQTSNPEDPCTKSDNNKRKIVKLPRETRLFNLGAILFYFCLLLFYKCYGSDTSGIYFFIFVSLSR